MKRRLAAAMVTMVLLLTGCMDRSGQLPPEYTPAAEDCLVVYTSHKEEVWWPIVKEFEERTGIWVDVVTGGTNELLQRIAQEGDAPGADVMFGGGVENLEAYSQYFEPYTCAGAEKIQKRFCSPEALWTPFSALPVVLIYNTKLVEPEWLTKWSDLLEDRFRGKIAFSDPGISGSSFTGLVTLLYALGGEPDDVMREFAANLEGIQLDSSGDVLTCVAGGTDWVGITLEESALKQIAAGKDIAMVYPTDGTSLVPDGSALVKGAAHRDNAQVFLDFTVSRDVQQLLPDQFYRRSVREDVDPGRELIALEEIPMVDYNISWASENRDRLLMTWAFYLGGEAVP